MNSANAALWRQFEGQSIENTYRLNRLIGVGGFAGVFEADHVVEGRMLRRVAVKLIAADSESMQRQLDELVAATMLHHPHLLGCFHAASTTLGRSKLLYLVMEMAQDTLLSRLATGLNLPQITALTEQVASALAYLHQKKMRVHRDLKPANVLLVEGDWKLSDFGTVRLSQGTASSHTAAVMGTVPYMPPESFNGTVSTAWDTWSFGVLLLESLTGKRPFTEITDGELVAAIIQKSPSIPEGLPGPFDQIVRGCLTKNHRERWSAQRVLDELKRPATLPPQTVVPPPEPVPAGVTGQQRQDAGMQDWLRDMRVRGAQATASRDLDGALQIWTEIYRVNPGDTMAKQAISSIQERQRAERSSAQVSRTASPPSQPVPSQPVPPKRRRRWVWLLAAVAVVFVAAGVWALVSQRGDSPEKLPDKSAEGGGPVSTMKTRVNPKDGLKYVWIPPGTFKMGCSDGDTECYPDEKPAHQVTITKGFWIGQTEVTQAAYQRVKGAASNPSHWKGPTLPVENISWDQAQAYCQAVGYRLPTEAEWEYAARGGNSSKRSGQLDEAAWYLVNSVGKTHPVGQKQPNGYGLYDTLGNVWEWVSDWYDAGYYGSSGARDPQNGSISKGRSRRGGSWFVFPRHARVSTRGWFVPVSPHYTIGVRCAGGE